ncbi:MAG: AAA family ATPase, partial [Prevotella sp.]|nr:AAA family ATPase [Prevotella sp.]
YGKTGEAVKINDRFTNLIMNAYKQTGQKVVVLIDEYDAPLLDVIHEEENLPVLRNVMRNFYSPLKACDPYLRFVFLTGITKFSQLSIFSELNNITNISMFPEYAGICGITKEEVLTQMSDYIDHLAEALNISREETIAKLTYKYDGYHFTWPSPDVFNPFSLLKAFTFNRLEDYWFGSGTPTYLIEMLRKYEVVPSCIGGMEAVASEFDAPTERMSGIVPLLYQSGYITIKDYDPMFEIYRLDIPNNEVRLGLMRSLIPSYVTPNTLLATTTIVNMARALYRDDMEGMLQLLKTFLLTVPECDNTDYEGHYQQMLYVIFSLLGQFADVEVRTATGRVDMVMRTATRLYVIELKINQSAAKAMSQINLKDYPARFALHKLPVVKVGINFSTKERTIDDWEIDL